MENTDSIVSKWDNLFPRIPELLAPLLIMDIERTSGDTISYSEAVNFIRTQFQKGSQNSSTIDTPVCADFRKRNLVERDSVPRRVPSSKVLSFLATTDYIIDTYREGPYIYTKPVRFKFLKESIQVSNWRELLVKYCAAVSDDNPRDFEKIVLRFRGNRKGRVYFSYDCSDLQSADQIAHGLYIETNLSANNIKRLCDVIHRCFSYGDELSVDTRPIKH